MSTVMILIAAVAGFLIDSMTTGVGISDVYGPIPAILGVLAIQAAQIYSMLALHVLWGGKAWGGVNRRYFLPVVLIVFITTSSINVLFNSMALAGGFSSIRDYLAFLFSRPESLNDVVQRIAILLLSFAITTEAETALLAFYEHRGSIAVSLASIPVYLSLPKWGAVAVGAIFRDEEGEKEGANPSLLLIPVAAVAILIFRTIDVYSSYVVTFTNLNTQPWIAMYASLLCVTVQAQAIMRLRGGSRFTAVDAVRFFGISLYNIYASAFFMSTMVEELSILALVLGVIISLLPEYLEVDMVLRVLTAANIRGNVEGIGEGEIARAMRAALPSIERQVSLFASSAFSPLRMVIRFISAAMGEVAEGMRGAMQGEEEEDGERPSPEARRNPYRGSNPVSRLFEPEATSWSSRGDTMRR